MSTNYNRYLDLHLCSGEKIAEVKERKLQKARATSYAEILKCHRKFFSHGGREYFYEFRDDMEKQARYRTGKSEGFTYDPDAMFAKGNCRNFCDVEITTADIGMLRLRNGEISDGLKQLRYVGCMVAIEQLKKRDVYPNFEGLVQWVADKGTTNKLRINCHGSGTSTGGYHMGDDELAVEDFVDALERHGLRRQGTVRNDGTAVAEKYQQNLSGLAHNARWKLDSEVSQCEKCRHQFDKTWYGSTTKHHCRRCGGIFCDTCTGKRADLRVALTGPNNATRKNVRNARVCDKCFAEARDQDGIRDATGAELKYGLQTISLGLCMGAKADERFSPELADGAAGALEAGSLAARLRDELTRRGLRGIKITASNAVVAYNDVKGLKNQFSVSFPRGNSRVAKQSLEARGEFEFPAYIWGSQDSLRTLYEQLPHPKPPPGIIVSRTGRHIYFGYERPSLGRAPVASVASTAGASFDMLRTLKEMFFRKWSFESWGVLDHPYSSTGAGPDDSYCLVLVAPPRVTAIQEVPAPPDNSVIRVTGRQVDTYKLTKSWGVS